MSFFYTQNPGIGVSDELTTDETLFIQNLEGLSYLAGDILYHNGTNLTRLGIGTAAQVLKVNAGATAPEWGTAGSGNVSKVGTPVNNQVGVWTGDGTIEGTADLTFDSATGTLDVVTAILVGPMTITGDGGAINATISSPVINLTTGSGGSLNFNFGGTGRFYGLADAIFSASANGPSLMNETATATNPVYAIKDDTDTGIGWGGADILSLIAGGVQGISISATAVTVPLTLLASGTFELGHATDTTLSRSAAGVLAVEGVVIPSISSTNTLTNKRITKRAPAVTQSATPAINTDVTDVAHITGLAQAITSMTSSLTGTPVEGDTLRIDITDNGTARAITWGASFEASGNVALPTTTVLGVRLDVGFLWNTVTSKWRCVATS